MHLTENIIDSNYNQNLMIFTDVGTEDDEDWQHEAKNIHQEVERVVLGILSQIVEGARCL